MKRCMTTNTTRIWDMNRKIARKTLVIEMKRKNSRVWDQLKDSLVIIG